MKRLAFALFLSATLVVPALALDLDHQITLIDGKPILDQAGKPQPMVLGDILKNTLLITDQQMTKEVKNYHFWLAVKIGKAQEEHKKDFTLTTQELADVEDALWKYQSILVAGQAIKLIDPSFQPPK